MKSYRDSRSVDSIRTLKRVRPRTRSKTAGKSIVSTDIYDSEWGP